MFLIHFSNLKIDKYIFGAVLFEDIKAARRMLIGQKLGYLGLIHFTFKILVFTIIHH